MEEENENKIKLIKVEIFANLNSVSEEHNKIEIETEFEYKESLIKKEIKELVEKFTERIQNYLNDDEAEEQKIYEMPER